MSEFETYLSTVLDDVKNSTVKEAMRYSLMAGGKRIRPQLLLSTLKAYGANAHVGYKAAAAIEMIHTYSLIHDDLPAMDNDTLRRGKPTCHVKYGEANAILAGDALLTQAFVLGANACEEADINCHIVSLLSRYSGADGMVLGQCLDLEGEAKKDITLEEMKEIHYYKTGRLLTLPLLCAAYLTHNEKDIPVWENIGSLLGLSFQIQDDVLDVTADETELGKNINSDADNNKTTYVTLLGIEDALSQANAYYEEALCLLDTLKINKEPLMEVFVALLHRKK